MSSSSSNVPNVKKGRGGRGGVPPPSVFPKVVYPVGPGSPAGIQPPEAMRDCILEFVGNSKTREGRELKKQLNERLGEIKALLNVERITNKQTDDGPEVSLDDDFSSIGLFDDADEISSSVKRKRLSTLAEVTLGTAQERQDKTSICT